MVNVEPFIFQKVTAFKERLQMVDKINEIIDAVNSMDIDPEQIQAMIEEALADYYTKEEVDELFANIDFSPYYTKTEVDVITDALDDRLQVAEGDIDALESNVYTKSEVDTITDAIEDRVQTNEDDIATLETSKQDVLTAGDGIDITNNTVSLSDWEFVPFDEWTSLMETYSTNGVKVKEDILLFLDYMPPNDSYKYYNFVPLYKNLVYSNFMSLIPIDANSSSINNIKYNNTGGIYVYLRTMYDNIVSNPQASFVNGIYARYMGLKSGSGSQYYEITFESTPISMNKVYYSDMSIDLTNQNGFGILRRKA